MTQSLLHDLQMYIQSSMCMAMQDSIMLLFGHRIAQVRMEDGCVIVHWYIATVTVHVHYNHKQH